VGIAIGAAVTFASAVVDFSKAAGQFVKAQEMVIRHLAEVGPAQAAAVARLDAERIGRDIKTAKETSGTSTQFVASQNRFEEALRPIESLMTDIANVVGSTVIGAISDVVEAINRNEAALGFLGGLVGGAAAMVEREARKNNISKDATGLEMIAALDDEAWKRKQPQWPNLGNGRRGAGR